MTAHGAVVAQPTVLSLLALIIMAGSGIAVVSVLQRRSSAKGRRLAGVLAAATAFLLSMLLLLTSIQGVGITGREVLEQRGVLSGPQIGSERTNELGATGA